MAIEGRLLDQLGFRVVLSGTVEIATSRGLAVAGTGDVQVIDLQKPAELACGVRGEAFAEITLWLPRLRLQSLIGNEYDLHGTVLKANNPTVRVLASALRSLSEEDERLTADLIDDLSDGLAALCAAASRQSSELPVAPHDSLAVICRYIESNLGARDLGVDKLVRTFGLSRASVYRLFEPLEGVATYIRSRRLERAYQEICAAGLDNRRIAPIAYRVGFRSMAAFNRAYQQAYACTPRETRARRAAGLRPGRHLAPSTEIGLLAHCLLDMSG
jgi:AraC-like DNA-binding protein